jgi:hypothetical protein
MRAGPRAVRLEETMLVFDTTAGMRTRAAGTPARLMSVLGAMLVSGLLAGCASDPEGGNDRMGSGATGAGSGANPGASGSGSPGGSGTGNENSGGSGNAGSNSGSSGSSSMAGSGSSTAGTTGGGSGAGAAVDCSALPTPTNMDDIVSTFEDGTGSVNQTAGRGGGFYMFNDMTGTQTPPPGGLPDATASPRCGGMFALCMKGTGFTVWGAGMGTDLGMVSSDDAGMMTKTSYDASMYKGISFWAKANPGSALALRVSLKDANTAPEGGVCDPAMTSGAEACNDDWGKNLTLTTEWAPYTVLYSELRQSMWGKQFPAFDDTAVYAIQYQVNKGLDFDLCIDDLAFVR